jgi:hypothetical protein
MGLSGVELATPIAPYDVLGICYHCGPVESLSKSLPDKCCWAYMMTACACVDLL